MSFVPDTQNKEFQDALNLIQYTRQSVFLTGKAGTGKSTFLKYICANTKKKHVVLAPTGIAAINAGGSTLHSFFKLPFYPLLPDDPNFSLQRGRIHEFFKYTKPHRKLLEELELVIIDEISMVRADIIDAVDRILRVYSRNLREPFGGKQILLVGDVFQLEPVVKGDEREILNRFYPTPLFLLCQSVRPDRPCLHRTAESIPANGQQVHPCAGPHPQQYRRLYRTSAAQHPLWHPNRAIGSRHVHHPRHPP